MRNSCESLSGQRGVKQTAGRGSGAGLSPMTARLTGLPNPLLATAVPPPQQSIYITNTRLRLLLSEFNSAASLLQSYIVLHFQDKVDLNKYSEWQPRRQKKFSLSCLQPSVPILYPEMMSTLHDCHYCWLPISFLITAMMTLTTDLRRLQSGS